MRQALIVTGGSIETFFCQQYMERHRFDLKTAVDSGLQFFYDTKQKPDRIVGDFDSIDEEVLRFFEAQEGIEWIRLNPQKDDTDTEAALSLALAEGYGKVHILGGMGRRLDHMLGNIGLLGAGLKMGIEVLLVDSHNRVRMIEDTFSILKQEQYGDYISLLPVTSEVRGITLTGMKYPLNDYTMESYHTVGISNEIVEDEAKICLKEGTLLVVESRD